MFGVINPYFITRFNSGITAFVVKTGFEPVFNVHSNLIIASFNNALPYGEGIRS
jgi:hypothetical protein